MLKNLVKEYIIQNRKIVIGLFICILIGIIAGIAIYKLSGKQEKDILMSQMTESIELSKDGSFIKTDIIYNGIRNNICYIFLMFLFSIMLYGTVFIYFLYIIKGVSIGIYIGTLFSIFGFWWGLLVILILVVLVNIVYLPAILFIGVTLINYNLAILEYRKDVRRVIPIPRVAFKVAFGVMIIFSSIIVEQLMSNFVIKISDNLQK